MCMILISHAAQLCLAIPLWVGAVSSSKSSSVNIHTMWCTCILQVRGLWYYSVSCCLAEGYRNGDHYCPLEPFVLGRDLLLLCASNFVRSHLAVDICLSVKRVDCDKTKAPSEKSSVMTNRKSPTSFPMSLRWTLYVAPNPQRGLKS